MRCFVTGVAGFVGSHLAERLLADGHEVCGIDSFANNYDRSFKEQNLEGPRSWNMFHFIEGDLVEVTLQPLLEGVDWIFHQAGQEKGQTNWASAFTHYTESNVLITLRLLEAALRFGWIRRFVYASSSSVYGKAAHLPIHEDELERPRSLHGVTKLAAESLCSLYHRRFGLPTVSLRYFSVYGPRQRPDMAFHRFCKAVVCRGPLYLYGGGYQTRDFIYVDDAVEATVRAAAASGATGQVMNIASGTSMTLRSIVELLEEISESRINVVVDDSQRDDVRHICADIQRAQQLLDYRPRMDLQDGLTHEFEFIRRLYEHWPNSAANGVVDRGSSDDISMLSDDYTATRKAKPVNLTPPLKPRNSQTDNHLAESIGDAAQRRESQMGAPASTWQRPQIPEISLDMPSDKQNEHARPISLANETTVGLTATPTLQTSPDSCAVESIADVEKEQRQVAEDYAAASKATAPKLTAVLESETRQADSQTVPQTPQISQAASDVAKSMADVEQRRETAEDYAVASKATAPELTAVLEPEARQADSQMVPQTPQISQAASDVAKSMADVEQRRETAEDYAVASKATAPELTAVLEPETRQTDSQTVPQMPQINQAASDVAESIADVEQRTGPQVDARTNVRQKSRVRQSRVNVPSNKQSERVKLAAPARSTGAPQTPTGTRVPPSRLTRPVPSQAEQNHMRVAIIALLLIGLLILGSCLAVYAQFTGGLSAVTGQAGVAPSAAITIMTDASKTLENTFSLTAVTGRPDAAQHQIKARQVSATTQPVSKSVQVANISTSANASGNDASQPASNDQNTTAQSVVQQSDIDTAANDLETANAPSAASILQPQLAYNEQFVGNPQCQPQVSADHKVGDVANSVMVTVVFSCSGEAYDQGAAEKMAAQELAEQAKKDIGDPYALSSQITTTVKDATFSDASQGTISISIDARGTWVLQLHRNQQQAWANSLAGKSKEDAQSFLLRQKGIKQADIQLQGGDGHTLPTDAKEITIKVQPVAGS